MAPRREMATQTSYRHYTFREADFVDFLVDYEFLVQQEQWARSERCPHEPALSLARRVLKAGQSLPRTLPVARPLRIMPKFYDHVGEPEWVTYDDADDMDDDDLLLDASRDLTEEEFARLLS